MVKKGNQYEELFKLADAYCQVLDKVKKEQPYHLNIIEELHINENAHSRILAKLLQYQDKDTRKYEFLESFFEYIIQKTGNFGDIEIQEPEVTQEKDRIDVLVLDGNQALIIENKICGANDQDKQLHRYVEKVKKKGYANGDIYIVYLTKYYKSPAKNTWSSKVEKDNFKARFCNLSYLYDILDWLQDRLNWIKEEEKKNNKKEIELKSALEQYINYLQILKNDNNMEAKKKQFFKNDENFKDIDKLIETQDSVEKFMDGIVEYKRNLIVEEINEWKKEIKKSDRIEIYKEEPEPEYNPLVVKWKKEHGTRGQDYFIFIKFAKPYENLENIYCVFQVEDTNNNISETNDTIKKIKKVMKDNCKDGFNEDKHTYECTWPINKTNLELAKKTFIEVLNVIK